MIWWIGASAYCYFDLRARGESGGNRSSEGDREQWDLLGAIDYVKARGIPVERIGLLGFSLAAGVAILVAAQEPRIPAIVSDSGVHGLRLGHPPDSYQRMGGLPAVLVFVLHTLGWAHPLPDGLSTGCVPWK